MFPQNAFKISKISPRKRYFPRPNSLFCLEFQKSSGLTDTPTILCCLQTAEFSRHPVVGDLATVLPSEQSDGLPATVIVEDVLVGPGEHGDHLKDPLGYLGDQGPHHLARPGEGTQR